MKHLLISLGICAAISAPAAAQGWRDNAVAAIKAEPKVVDAMFTQDISLWVSVPDDGSRRDGLAEFFCLLVHESGMESSDFVIIKVWDAAAMARGDMREIGKTECQGG
jgi:hypothetical protein